MGYRSKLPTAAFGSLALLACGTLSLAAGNPASAPTPAKSPAPPAKTADAAPAPSSDHIQVQHILIGYKGSVPGKAITRTVEEARKLADELTARARKGDSTRTRLTLHGRARMIQRRSSPLLRGRGSCWAWWLR